MDAKDFFSCGATGGPVSYSFKPKPPDNWVVKEYNRSDKKVNLITLKPWQIKAHLHLRDANFGLLRAFCGSGKTILARSIGAYKTYTTGKRQVYCVPKNDIGNDGFASYFDIEIPWNKKKSKILHCDAPYNFCDTRAESKIDELIRILSKPPIIDDSANKDRILSTQQIVCTHQCLTLAIRKIKDNPNNYPSNLLEKIISNNTFWIDESHHIKGHDESEEEKVTMNLLGKFVNYIIERENTGVELFAMTATPYRGDYSRLFSLKQLENFTSYSLDFLEYFPTLGISKVDMSLEEYDDIHNLVKKVCHNLGNEIDKHHIIFVPPTGRKWRKNKDDVYILFDEVYKTYMNKLGISLENAKSRVLDLVTENTQSFNDRLLRQEPKSGETHPSKFNVIIACMKCREGSDWCPADRVHNTSMEDSPPLNFQTNGRLFRHYPGKNHVKIQYYVEKFKNISINSNNKREFVSDRVNSILHYMLMDDLLNPILVDVPCFVSAANKKNKSLVKRKYTTLEDIFDNQYQDMKKYFLTSISDIDFNEKSVNHVIAHVIQKYLPNKKYTKGQITEIKLALKAFLLRSRSSKLRGKGIDVSFIRKNGFDVIVEKNKLHGNMYTCNLNQKEFERFRELIKEQEFTSEQIKKVADGIRTIVVKELGEEQFDDTNPVHNMMANKLAKEFPSLHKVYRESFGTKDYCLEGIANKLKKPIDYVQKKIDLFNKFCLSKDTSFDFDKDSLLAKKITFGDAA